MKAITLPPEQANNWTQSAAATLKDPASEGQLPRYFASTQRLKVRLDADGTLIVPGKFGRIYEYDHCSLGVMILPVPPRKNYWGVTRNKLRTLGFLIAQNGDREGSALFDSGNADQAKEAIRVAGVKRKWRISPEQRGRQIGWLRATAGRAL